MKILTARDFPRGTPLNHFFLWNERRWRRDRRYELARAPERLPAAVAAALTAAIGNPDHAAQAAVFAAFEALDPAPPEGGRRILVIRLSAFGDFIQALGPFAAIRRHHRGDRITLLTTAPYAAFAEELGYFDAVLIDGRPGPLAPRGWFALRRQLRRGGFDRVYDLQTSQRSSAYFALLWPDLPQWSGVALGCSHPHADPNRDRGHTLAKQAEQLLMAGIYPTPAPQLPPFGRALPAELHAREFVLLVPGSSPRHPAKRWPTDRFAALARALSEAGYLPVVVGAAHEARLAATIRDACPQALDLVGRTDISTLAALTQRAALTVGNDTGVCHLAAVAGCPLIVLFSRETDPARHAPHGRAVKVLAAPDLADLGSDAVAAEALGILAAREPRPATIAVRS
jgi:ADP-heptose:LPS heptosyltransferase